MPKELIWAPKIPTPNLFRRRKSGYGALCQRLASRIVPSLLPCSCSTVQPSSAQPFHRRESQTSHQQMHHSYLLHPRIRDRPAMTILPPPSLPLPPKASQTLPFTENCDCRAADHRRTSKYTLCVCIDSSHGLPRIFTPMIALARF
ncbi:hypothetical protein P154DRAFT_518994 [Amniculicola lignicola CBS 123094]|uniref:Uncharacterized protein n=1 Tax=Amniculicola lignicola CBS 123094 TaxID=1392246 RepID=A0A6A5WUZ9_9PLEO|nr:hypothetical protein P154DRAFT_518994 [Amniculicola lignicola CBS 123094]